MLHRPFRLTLAALLAGASLGASAHELYSDAERHLNANVEAVFGAFHSERSYVIGRDQPGSTSWQEGYIKYGLSADQRLGSMGALYGAFALLSSATWGDGDAAGFSDGSERTSKVEDAYLGWKSGNLVPMLGEDGIDLSFGKQMVAVGDGFLLQGDSLNVGHGLADGQFNRGGAYYLAARKSFDKTAVLRLGGKEGVHGSLMWIKSDNRAQAETELAAGTLDYTAAAGTLGLTWVHGMNVTDQWASDFQKQREGLDTYSLRGEGSAGIDNASFAFEYAWQDKDAGPEKAWYAEAGYTFADVGWSPKVTYRYTRYSQKWDPLFTGLSTGYGTWFQGEVASNYAGPFNSNTGIHHVGLKATPLENLTVGALYFDFNTLRKNNALNLDARELDLYAEWAVNSHLIISPLVGIYQPKKDADSGGNQVGGNGTNLYSQLTVAVPF